MKPREITQHVKNLDFQRKETLLERSNVGLEVRNCIREIIQDE